MGMLICAGHDGVIVVWEESKHPACPLCYVTMANKKLLDENQRMAKEIESINEQLVEENKK